MANLVCGIKKFSTPKGRKGWITTDNRRWKVALLANEWQKRLNKSAAKKAVKVLAGEGRVKEKRNYSRKGIIMGKRSIETVGASPKKRRAIRALGIKHNLNGTGSIVITINRLLNAINEDKSILKDLLEVAKMG